MESNETRQKNYFLQLLASVTSGVICSPRHARLEGSNPAEVVGFFDDLKLLSTEH